MKVYCPVCSKELSRPTSMGGHIRRCPVTPEQLFWMKVKKGSGCWLWTGAKTDEGYGTITLNRITIKAHRMSYEMAHGAITNGLYVLHRCDNRLCVNPEHLFLGDHQANCDDKWAKGRGATKLNDDAVRDIRRSTLTSRELADKYGVKYSAIWAVRTGRKWKHVAPSPDGKEER